MMPVIHLFWAELKRAWIQYIRYPAEALGGILITTFFFYALFAGAQYVAGPASQFGERLDAVVIGYVLWTLVIFVVNDIALNLQVEAQTGTLEQVLLSPFSAATLFLARACASLVLRFSVVVVILGAILLLTGSRLRFPPSLVLPLLSVVLGAYGFSFLLGSARTDCPKRKTNPPPIGSRRNQWQFGIPSGSASQRPRSQQTALPPRRQPKSPIPSFPSAWPRRTQPWRPA